MSKNPTYKRVTITRTSGEWEEIEKRIKKMKRGDINVYLRGELHKLKNQFTECPGCITPASGKPKAKQHCVPIDVYEQLEELSKIMKRPIASIVDDFFIVPLLSPAKT